MTATANNQWEPNRGAAEVAREVLPAMAAELFAAGRTLAAGDVDMARLHQFRLRAKKFRYTLELFEPLYGPAAEAKLGKLRRMQGHLGRINDCVSARGLVEQVGRLPRARQVLRSIGEAEKQRVKRFFRFWRESFDIEGEQERWVRYLRDYAGRAGDRGEAGEPDTG